MSADDQLAVINACFAAGKLSDNDKSFLEEKWIESQKKGGSEEDIHASFDKALRTKFGPRVSAIKNLLTEMKASLAASNTAPMSAVPQVSSYSLPTIAPSVAQPPLPPLQSMSAEPLPAPMPMPMPMAHHPETMAMAAHPSHPSQSAAMPAHQRSVQVFGKILKALKEKTKISATEAERLYLLKKESYDTFPNNDMQAREYFHQRLSQEFGPRSMSLIEIIRIAERHVQESMRNRIQQQQQQQQQQSLQAQQMAQVPGVHPGQMYASNPMVLPAVGMQPGMQPAMLKAQPPLANMSANMSAGMKRVETKPPTATPTMGDTVLSEIVKTNPEGEDGMTWNEHRFVIQEAYAGEEQDVELRNLPRHRLEQEARSGDTMDTEGDVDVESAISTNVLNLDTVTRLFRNHVAKQGSFGLDLDMTPDAKRLLSEGIQMHLRNILEAAIRLSHSRLNRRPYLDHALNFNTLSAPDGVQKMTNSLALKWAPNVREILAQEERALQTFLSQFRLIEERVLLEDMRHADEEFAKQGGVGAKRKAGQMQSDDDQQWWERDTQAEAKGRLNWEHIDQVWMKMKIAETSFLGPFKKKAPAGKPSEMEGKPAQLINRSKVAVPSLEPEGPRARETFEMQMQFCNETLDKRAVEVKKDDMFEVINKAGVLGNEMRSRKFLAYWKLKK